MGNVNREEKHNDFTIIPVVLLVSHYLLSRLIATHSNSFIIVQFIYLTFLKRSSSGISVLI